MKVLITGAGGQVGRALIQSIPAGIEVRAVSHAELDIGDEQQVNRVAAEFRPELIVNAAAYTAVDKAEADEVGAIRGNVDGPRNLAMAAHAIKDARLIHISTDFVFDGSGSSPYKPTDATHPLGVYGRTKFGGELAVRQELGDRAVIVRTAWVYAAQGNNFLRTMLRLMKERGAVRVVGDQIGTPTAAHSLAQVLWRFATRPDLAGVFHWTDAGVASWYDFAVAIAEEASARGLLKADVRVAPIATEDYPTPAKRPAYSVLDKRATLAALNIETMHWRQQLRTVIGELSLA